MLYKIFDFIKEYIENVDELVIRVGKYKTISGSLNELINRQVFSKEELRKKLSVYMKRIISEREFEQILNYNMSEYAPILYE